MGEERNEITCGLWSKTTRYGKPYLSSSSLVINGEKYYVNIFENERPKGDSSPAYYLKISPASQATVNTPRQDSGASFLEGSQEGEELL